MEFQRKLWKIRTDAAVTQEKLAEVLGVSRQAVAKWESGGGMPGIDHLIRISNFFQVTVDSLIKNTAYVNDHETKYDSDDLRNFVVEAKKSTYASLNAFSDSKRESTRLASKDLCYEKGDYKYWDSYVGGTNFSGTEVVWKNEVAIWSMNYFGRTITEENSEQMMDFLMEVLSKVEISLPYRGPAVYRNGKLTYTNTSSGDFSWFQGSERIYYEEELIYELNYIGGEVHP
ncbi:MAG: DUF5680 domain-containing protein [Turicibacter sp.]|nr:DUF5680 domain-containing protein [Turicibacter sp.]